MEKPSLSILFSRWIVIEVNLEFRPTASDDNSYSISLPPLWREMGPRIFAQSYSNGKMRRQAVEKIKPLREGRLNDIPKLEGFERRRRRRRSVQLDHRAIDSQTGLPLVAQLCSHCVDYSVLSSQLGELFSPMGAFFCLNLPLFLLFHIFFVAIHVIRLYINTSNKTFARSTEGTRQIHYMLNNSLALL